MAFRAPLAGRRPSVRASLSDGVGNPTTWNGSDKGANITLSGGDLTFAMTAGANGLCRSVASVAAGKWYWEHTFSAATQAGLMGVATSAPATNRYPGQDTTSWAYFGFDGKIYNNNASAAYGNTFTAGDVIGVALDAGVGSIWFSKNGTWQNSGDPATAANAAFTGMGGPFFACSGGGAGSAFTMTTNFGASAFSQSVPSGFRRGFGS